MDREFLIRFVVACGIGYVLTPLWVILAYKSTLTKNKSTAIGFLLATAWAIAFSFPDVRVDTVVPSLVLIVTGTLTFRAATPYILRSAHIGRRMREQRGLKDQQRKLGGD